MYSYTPASPCMESFTLNSLYFRLDSTNILEFYVKWQKNKGLDPDGNPTHLEYLSDLAESVQTTLTGKIADTADLLEVQSGSLVYQEVLCHGQYCKERAKTFWVCVMRILYCIINIRLTW